MPDTEPRALQVLRGIVARLQVINTDDDFNTDAGATADVGPSNLANVDASVAVQFDSEDVGSNSTGKSTGDLSISDSFRITLNFTVVGTISSKPGQASPSKGVRLELLKADIKRALFLRNPTDIFVNGPNGFGPIVYAGASMAPRQDGNEDESVQVKGVVTYFEAHGNPYGIR